MEKRLTLKIIFISVISFLFCAVIIGVSYYEYYNIIPFQRGIGLTASQVAKIKISIGNDSYGREIGYETTDPQKIDEFYNSLKHVKLYRDWHPVATIGRGYILMFYPKQGKGFILYDTVGYNCFLAVDGYTGSGLPNTTYWPKDRDQLIQIIENFYGSLGHLYDPLP